MQGLLYPAYQKFYSALSSLERFGKESNFFDNISCLDNFFSEYRNVTFVVQSQLKHTEHFEKYIKNRDLYLKDHWFVTKRNETVKQTPFQLQKIVKISVYIPFGEITIVERQFTVEDDIPIDSLKKDIEEFFKVFSDEEIFFSVAYCFYEVGSNDDLFSRIFTGISSMNTFLESLNREIGEDSPLIEQLKQKIDKLVFPNVPRDFLLTDDYVYYKDNNEFERAGRLAFMLSLDGKKMFSRRPLKEMTGEDPLNYDGTAFGKFTLMHVLIRSTKADEDIMPAIMIIYGDDTYDLDVFHADIKTTVYRKINETAKIIENEDVREVCFMSLYAVYRPGQDVAKKSKERVLAATEDVLVVASVNFKLEEKEYVFEGNRMQDPHYVGHIMKEGLSTHLNASRLNMFPIYQAFKTKSMKTKTEENDSYFAA